MRTGTRTRTSAPATSRWAALLGVALLFPAASAMAQGANNCPAGLPDNIVCNGQVTGIPTAGGFLFEPEVPYISLKHAPTWSELEQMLDNPYAQTSDALVCTPASAVCDGNVCTSPISCSAGTPGNDQGFPSYRSLVQRRQSFSGVLLPQFHVHPLNYNTTTGEEMRLINNDFTGGTFRVTNFLDQFGTSTRYDWVRRSANISAGSTRVEPGSIPIDYNNPIAPDATVFFSPGAPPGCVATTETFPPEGSFLCGGDPGEPGYLGFGRLGTNNSLSNRGRQYSTPAFAIPYGQTANEGVNIAGIAGFGTTRLLYDPTPDAVTGVARGFIPPRNPVTGVGGLRKPSLRLPANGGTPAAPNYAKNIDPDAVTASSENDYVRDANVAAALGKALFWDMQVGSDGVQSCGTCHFNGTGTDTRTKNQLNPNHLGGDNTLQVGDTPIATGGMAANYQLKPSDFPLHKLKDHEIAGDPACPPGDGLVADATTIPYLAQVVLPGGYAPSQAYSNPVTGKHTVCSSDNIADDKNDVVSSMGVHWGIFKDIAPIGSFAAPDHGVSAVKPDLRETSLDCEALGSTTAAFATCIDAIKDPIAPFAGAASANILEPGTLNEFRRVEPRNTPTMQGAGFNFDNFWDGRARHDFNGGSVFGAADPQMHVHVGGVSGALTPTRQIIRFTSLASLATGPGLSEFEMSFLGRNWSKIGKKLLQTGAVPLANQLVSPTDSLLGPYSNQPGNATPSPLCGANLATRVAGKPGLCVSYRDLIAAAYYPALHQNTGSHLIGCYTDGRIEIHPNQCGTTDPTTGVTYPPASVRVLNRDPNDPNVPLETVVARPADPFDGYVLSAVPGAVNALDTNQFTQMEGNFSLFWGLSVQKWVNLLVPDDTPFDQFLDRNPGAFRSLGEPGEAGLVDDLLRCGQTAALPLGGSVSANPNYCFTEWGNFKRDGNVKALVLPTGEGAAGGQLVPSGGTRTANAPDPLLGMDIFFASNLSLKNPNFRTGRCGECHAIPTLTDHTMPFTSKINLMDAVAEFRGPGVELILEPLARLRVITGFLLESEINENGQDAVERRIVDQSLVPNPVDGLAYPGATPEGLPGWGAWTGADSAFLDNGMYNLGIRPTKEDIGRGGNDAFGWPLSIAALMMKNLGGEDYNPGGDQVADNGAQPPAPGIPLPNADPGEPLWGYFGASAQDPLINPGYEGEPENPMVPSYLGDFINNITVGDFPPELDEAGGAIGGMVNTLTDVAMIEGFMDTLGPFNPANIAAEVLNFGGFPNANGDCVFGNSCAQMGTWPNVNRVGRMGAFKAAPLRNVELTGPYFHNGGKLTLRQVVDFYTRGGDFPLTNKAHRDFNLVNMTMEIQSNLSEAELTALVDFLLELTDERNRWARAPFDHPQVIVAADGHAPDNNDGRLGLLAADCGGSPCFMDVNAVGAGGRPAGASTLNTGPEPRFMNVTTVRVSGADAEPGKVNCDYTGALNGGVPTVSHYCH